MLLCHRWPSVWPVLGFTLLVGCATPPADRHSIVTRGYEATRTRVAEMIPDEMAKQGVVGLSIALVDDHTVVWADGFGYADEAVQQPATPQTVYRVGSIAKLLTSLAIMRLEEEGKLDIDQALTAYLPQFSVRSRFSDIDPITPRNVMTHHSGLPCDLNKGMWTDMELTEVLDKMRNEYVAYPPGYVFAYSNVGYSLLGQTIHQVTGRDFVDYMDEEVLHTLGMNHSSFVLKPHIAPYLSRGYRDGREEQLLPMRDLPAVSLYSNVLDLSRFLMMVFAGGYAGHHEVVMRASLDEMLEPQNADVPLDFDFRVGLGWFLEGRNNGAVGPVALHGGTTLLFNSQIIILPRHKLGVVVLSNSAHTRHMVARIAEGTLKLALEEKTGLTPPTLVATRAPPDINGSVLNAGLEGQYATGLGLIEIAPRVGQLCACNIGKTLNVAPLPDGWFQTQVSSEEALPPGYEKLAQLQFTTKRVEDKDVLVMRGRDKEYLLGAKVPDRPIPSAWLRRIGSYQVTNEDPHFPVEGLRLENRNGVLHLRYRMPMLSHRAIALPIMAISDREAITLGLGRTRGETVRIVDVDGEERLVYSGYQARRQSAYDFD